MKMKSPRAGTTGCCATGAAQPQEVPIDQSIHPTGTPHDRPSSYHCAELTYKCAKCSPSAIRRAFAIGASSQSEAVGSTSCGFATPVAEATGATLRQTAPHTGPRTCLGAHRRASGVEWLREAPSNCPV
jgi:hypothetical protein